MTADDSTTRAARAAAWLPSVDTGRRRHPVVAPVFFQHRPQHLIEVLAAARGPSGAARLPARRRASGARRSRVRSAAARALRDDARRPCRTRTIRRDAPLRGRRRCRAATARSCTPTRPLRTTGRAGAPAPGRRAARRRQRDRVRERKTGCPLARDTLDELEDLDVRGRFLEAEARRVAERQQIDERVPGPERGFAQRHRATGQDRQLERQSETGVRIGSAIFL